MWYQTKKNDRVCNIYTSTYAAYTKKNMELCILIIRAPMHLGLCMQLCVLHKHTLVCVTNTITEKKNLH
jgi:hypothetical protein